jgi:1-acyl-sn-glycerol-3-phosphate acyltransferase
MIQEKPRNTAKSPSAADRAVRARLAAFEPPSHALMQATIAPLSLWFDPRAYGLENIKPERPCLFVGNHTLYGVFDFPLILNAIYRERGVFPRSLADKYHFALPYWRAWIEKFGIVEGSRQNCSALMEQGQHVLVYPGGAREVCKRHGEQYTLTWKQRTGFAYMAIEHGYDILPFASVGPDNAFSIVADADDILNSPVGTLLRATGLAQGLLRNGEFLPPISRGIGLTSLPRPERFYFSFGKPIKTESLRGQQRDVDALWRLRGRVEKAITREIEKLLLIRERDTDQGFVRRLLRRL